MNGNRLLRAVSVVFLLACTVTSSARAAGPPSSLDEEEAVRATALDYIEGAHEGSAERVADAIHEELHKVLFIKYPQTGRHIPRVAGYSTLLEVVRSGRAVLPPEERDIQVKIYSVTEGIAAVRVTSSIFYDYLMMVRIDGKWKISSTLYDFNRQYLESNRPQALEEYDGLDPEREKDAIRAAALDYIEGYFTGDSERMERAVFSELVKMRPRQIRGTDRKVLEKIGATMLIEASAGGGGRLDRKDWEIDLRILDHERGIAMVEIISSQFFDYLQLARINDEWKIVNVLWVPNPERKK